MEIIRLSLLRYEYQPICKGILIRDFHTIAYTIEPPFGHPELTTCGEHACVLFDSEKFGHKMIRIIDEHFPDMHVLFHAGNYGFETENCILLGDQPSITENRIWNSQATCAHVLTPLMQTLNNGGKVLLTVSNWLPVIVPAE